MLIYTLALSSINMNNNTSVIDISRKKIKSLNDLIQDDNEVLTMDCSYNYLLEISQLSLMINLKSISIRNNFIKNIYVLNGLNHLVTIDCSKNKITSILLDKVTTLTYFDCSYNHLLDLSNLPVNIMKLICKNNKIKNIDVSKLKNLYHIDCSYNMLSSINMTQNTKLGFIYCKNNFFDEIHDMDYIEHLINHVDISNNFIRKLPKFNRVGELCCSYNKLKSVSLYPMYIKYVKTFICSYNLIENFDFSYLVVDKNFRMNVSYNNISYIDFSKYTDEKIAINIIIRSSFYRTELLDNNNSFVRFYYSVNNGVKEDLKKLNTISKMRYTYYSIRYKDRFINWLNLIKMR